MLELQQGWGHDTGDDRPPRPAGRGGDVRDPLLRVEGPDLLGAYDGQPASLRAVDAAPDRVHPYGATHRAQPRRDRRGPGDPARRPGADEVRLAPAEQGLATAPRRADRADRAAA